MENNYKIKKILNHNVIMVNDSNKQEWILFGAGIGFQKQIGETVSKKIVENKYALFDDDKLQQYQKLLNTSNELASFMSEWIISEMKKRFSDKYNPYLHISLLDHLNFALKRLQGNLVINNLFDSELKFIYPKEYAFSYEMVNKISSKLKLTLPESEVGMITLHIHSALHNEKVSNTALIMNIVTYCFKFLEQECGKVEDDILKNRLIIHLKFAIKRSIEKINLNNDLNEVIKNKFVKSYEMAKKVADKINDVFMIKLNESEIVYLSIHLQNIFHFKGE